MKDAQLRKARLRRIIPILLITATVLTIACSRHVRPEYSGHPVLYCGWLDIRESDYKKVGYNSRAEWKIIIERINVYFLQKHVTDYCGSFKVIGARSKSDTPPPNAYHVKYHVISFDPGGTAMTVEVKLIDGASKRTITTFTTQPSGVVSMAGVTFMGRMATICQKIAQDIAARIYE
jgi:hypothetical protein